MDLHPRRALGAATMKHPPWLLASPGELVAGRIVVLDSMEARHVAGPLRMRLGDRVFVTDGAGAVASGTLSLLGRSAAEVSIDAVEDRTPSAPGLTLAVALLAGSAMDLVIQKAVELGVERLLPVGCQRSQIGLKRAMTRMDHWHRIARQALKQCHRAWAMELAIPRPLAEAHRWRRGGVRCGGAHRGRFNRGASSGPGPSLAHWSGGRLQPRRGAGVLLRGMAEGPSRAVCAAGGDSRRCRRRALCPAFLSPSSLPLSTKDFRVTLHRCLTPPRGSTLTPT